jgi:hypothetical protein
MDGGHKSAAEAKQDVGLPHIVQQTSAAARTLLTAPCRPL